MLSPTLMSMNVKELWRTRFRPEVGAMAIFALGICCMTKSCWVSSSPCATECSVAFTYAATSMLLSRAATKKFGCAVLVARMRWLIRPEEFRTLSKILL